MGNDISDAQTYCCDVPECQVPVVLSALVRVGKEHWCRSCYERLHPNAGRSTNRADGNELAKGSTVEDWPGSGE